MIALMCKNMKMGDSIDILKDLGRPVVRLEKGAYDKSIDRVNIDTRVVLNGSGEMLLDSGQSFDYPSGIFGKLEVTSGTVNVFY